jgi:molybdenum cofactor guanylyltransferase
MGTAAIVLAGGGSTRMGAPKAALEWHGSTLVRRVAGIVGRVAGPVVVVRAPGQALPPLPAAVRVVEDAREGRGPLQGLLAGLEALDPDAAVAFVAAVDAPLLHPGLVRRALAACAGADAAVPRAGGRAQPLAAAYRPATVRPRVERLLAEDRRSLHELLVGLRIAWLDAGDADGLRDLDDAADYAAARALPPPEVRIARDGGAPVALRAATLAAAVGDLGGLEVRLDGARVDPDPELPLAEGDLLEVRRLRPG